MLTSSTETRCCHTKQNQVSGELVRLGCGALLRSAILGTLEDSEGRHFGSGYGGGLCVMAVGKLIVLNKKDAAAAPAIVGIT